MNQSNLNGPVPDHRFLPFLDWHSVRDLEDKANTPIVLPVGATEQHGPHLPTYVDTVIPSEVVGRALAQLDDAIPAYALPAVWCGKSNEHNRFPGTIALRAETLIAMLTDIGESLYRSGFRKLIFANGHGGQPQVLDIVARDLREKYPDFMVFPWFVWTLAPEARAELPEKERELGMHAGTAETAIMWALIERTVKMDRAVCEYPPETVGGLTPEGALPYAWLAHDVSESGVVGDATAATRESGERMAELLIDAWTRAIATIHEFRMPRE
ncbi:creatinine amidohydrolase protein [Salinisphaera shabanensis E1L3A]|uniref:Creatinine amidohydrolase protein n=1 Tax=Salinisphaera shabanensis E1L3A TaxID=1033802 RepID=U2FZW6_9GAMM|nr:creatininase family protein [Salinisphaera shabanensis]ERJ19623.1 creatinine amidohydrolase protein [Salinisphaera shabanensis E1L3A]